MDGEIDYLIIGMLTGIVVFVLYVYLAIDLSVLKMRF
jgi:hypothetical protein